MRFLVLALVGFVASCANASLKGGGGDGDTAGASPSSETGKPSEDTEGVPGYLVDPELIAMAAAKGGVEITGKAGAIRVPAGGAEAVVSIFTSKPAAVADALVAGDDTLVATFEKSVNALADGSFVAKIEAAAGDLIILVAGAAKVTEVVLPEQAELTAAVSGLFDGQGGIFTVLAKTPIKDEGIDVEENETAATDEGKDPVTEEPSEAKVCGGAEVGGACWYLAPNAFTSCASVCASRGGYDEATSTYAGDAGTLVQCYMVLDALGDKGMNLGDVPGGIGIGCATTGVSRVRWTSAKTDATSILGGYRRACACRE